MSRLITINKKLKRLQEEQAALTAQEKAWKREINQLSQQNAARAERLIGKAVIALRLAGLSLPASAIYEKAKEIARPNEPEALERVAADLRLQTDVAKGVDLADALAMEDLSHLNQTRQAPEGTPSDQLAPATSPVVPVSSSSPTGSISPRTAIPFNRLTAPPRAPNRGAINQNGDHQPLTGKTIE